MIFTRMYLISVFVLFCLRNIQDESVKKIWGVYTSSMQHNGHIEFFGSAARCCAKLTPCLPCSLSDWREWLYAWDWERFSTCLTTRANFRPCKFSLLQSWSIKMKKIKTIPPPPISMMENRLGAYFLFDLDQDCYSHTLIHHSFSSETLFSWTIFLTCYI